MSNFTLIDVDASEWKESLDKYSKGLKFYGCGIYDGDVSVTISDSIVRVTAPINRSRYERHVTGCVIPEVDYSPVSQTESDSIVERTYSLGESAVELVGLQMTNYDSYGDYDHTNKEFHRSVYFMV